MPDYDDLRLKYNYGSLENPPYYVTAYGIAVKHGYQGTEEEWIHEIQESAHDSSIAAAESAEAAAGSADTAEAYGAGTRGGEPLDEDDPAYHNNAQYYSDHAEAYGAGTRGGEPVEEDDPAYHNNAQYYAGQAQATADGLDARLDAQDTAIATIRSQVASPYVIAATGAAMTDQTKAYVYVGDGTGDDAGLVNGAWYYYDADEEAWTQGGTATDPTLSVAGAAADAKATGDSFKSALINRGQLTSTDAMDSVTAPGTYWCSSTSLPSGWPFSGGNGRLLVLGSSGTGLLTRTQIAILTNTGDMQIRCGTSASVWGGWSYGFNMQPYPEMVTASVATANGWSDIYDLPGNRIYQIGSDLPSSFGLADNSALSSLIVFKPNKRTNNSTWKNICIQSIGAKMYIKNGTSGWNVLLNDDAIHALQTDVDNLKRTESFDPNISWEQGGFTVSTWSKNSSTSSTHSKYIRFVEHPSLAGVGKIRITLNSGYMAYVSCKGWGSSVLLKSSSTITLGESDRTELNITLTHNPRADTVPSEGENCTITFIPVIASLTLGDSDSIVDEVDGLIIPDETTPIKIGLYGASIVAGQMVSNFSISTYRQGPRIKMEDYVSGLSTWGDFNSYSGDLSWARQFEAYMEANYPNVSIGNWAIPTVDAAELLSCLEESASHPRNESGGVYTLDIDVDIAIIMLGNNGRGMTIRENINGFEGIIQFFQDRGVKVFFMTPTPAYNTSSSFQLNTYQIMQASKKAASELNVCTLDAFNWIVDYCDQNGVNLTTFVEGSQNFFYPQTASTTDFLHPGDLGHTIIFKALRSLLKV